MGYYKNLDIRIRSGGDDAMAAALELVPRWISVGERLPEDIPHGYCLVTDGTNVGTANDSKEFQCFYHCIDRDYWKPTHWMPLPEPPLPSAPASRPPETRQSLRR
jgi:hypothetical protein